MFVTWKEITDALAWASASNAVWTIRTVDGNHITGKVVRCAGSLVILEWVEKQVTRHTFVPIVSIASVEDQ
jgi:hypothetical protein